MASYKAVMRSALGYASSIWSPLASSAGINKLQGMHNEHKTRTFNICTTKHLYFPYTSTYSSTRLTQPPSHPLHKHKHISTLQSLKNTIFNNGRYTTNFHTVTTTDIKTNMRHMHTSIVSRPLATRGKSKIRRTPLPHFSSSEEILPRFTRFTLAQFRTNKSPFLLQIILT